MKSPLGERLRKLEKFHQELIRKRNEVLDNGNGIFDRYRNPILTAAHTPLFWRYDLNNRTNPFEMERFGINAVFNTGAIKWKDKYGLVTREEGTDRKSFFAMAESDNGIDHFHFWD